MREGVAAVGVVMAAWREVEDGKRVSKVKELAFEDSFLVFEVGKRRTDFHVWDVCVLRD